MSEKGRDLRAFKILFKLCTQKTNHVNCLTNFTADRILGSVDFATGLFLLLLHILFFIMLLEVPFQKAVHPLE